MFLFGYFMHEMKTAEIILLEAQLGATRELTSAKNNELASLAYNEVINLMKRLSKAHERAAARLNTSPEAPATGAVMVA